MTHTSDEQLQDLVNLCNNRLREFGPDTLPPLSWGMVRLLLGAVEEWQQAQDEDVLEEYANARLQAYEKGYDAGLRDAAGTPDFDGGFYTHTNKGHPIHINGDPNMSEETANALSEMADKVFEQMDTKADKAIAKAYEQWDVNAITAAIVANNPDVFDQATGVSDDDWCGPDEDEEAEPNDYDPMLDFGSSDPNAPATPLSREVAATLGPEHTIVTPLHSPVAPKRADSELDKVRDFANAIGVAAERVTEASKRIKEPVAPVAFPRTLDEVDAAAEQLSEIIEAIQAMAEGGVMPRVSDWNREKPPHLPVWQQITVKHDIPSWGAMAELCGLETLSRNSNPNMTPARLEQLERLKEERRAANAERNGGRPKSEFPTYDEFAAEIRRQAVGTRDMPSMGTFNAAKPARWASAESLVQRFNTTWNQVATELGLTPRTRFGGKADSLTISA